MLSYKHPLLHWSTQIISPGVNVPVVYVLVICLAWDFLMCVSILLLFSPSLPVSQSSGISYSPVETSKSFA